MILVRHLLRLVRSTLRFGVATGRTGTVLLVLLGLVVVALALAGSTAAPFVLYPFV